MMAEGGHQLLLQSDQRIVKQGWLSKRGEYIRNWRQRYFFLLDNGMLLGFKTMPEEDLNNPLNNFTVKGCQTLKTDHPKPNTFIIRGLHWTTVIERTFNAQTKEDRNAWVEAIERVKDSLMEDTEDGGLALGGVGPGEEKDEDGGDDDGGDPDANSGVEYLPAPQGTTAMGPYKKRKKLSLESFDLLSGLGKGTFGRVILAREKTSGNIYAIKMLRKDVILEKDEVEHTLTENRVLQRIDHPFLMYLKYSFTTKDRLCFVLEYVTGGELFHHLTRERIFSEERTKFYGAEICLALGYLHHCNIIYRDLKLENLLIDAEGHIKVADFGLCKENMSYGNTTRTFCGTPEYLAPEVLEENDYGRSVDWWGYGVCLYEMMVGRLPFFNNDHEKLFQQIVYEEARFPRTISAEARDLLKNLLVKNPHQRLGGGVRDALEVQEHAFYFNINWDLVLNKQIPPPFIPEVSSDTDTHNYDPEFTTPVHITPPGSQSSLIIIHEQDETFSLSSLSRHAEDLFGEMIADSTAIMNRTISLQGRVDKLAVKVKNLDSNVEEVSLQDIHMRKAFKSSTLFDQQVVSRDTVPAAMLETYTHCDHPPPLDQLNPYRDDGKDGLKFYTDPDYFFNLWREEMTKETEQLKDNKKKPGKPKSDGRKQKKIRQAANTRDKHKQLVIDKGEHIAENHYKAPGQGADESAGAGKPMHRPNSIELATSHQAPQPPSTHHQNDHPTYITNNSGNHLSPHHQQQQLQQQQQMAGSNGAAGQMQGYGTAGNYPESYLNQENFGIYGTTTYNPATDNGDAQGGTPNRVNSRIISSRPSQPPPAPPSGSNTPTPPPSSHSGTPTRILQQMGGRDSLPPPPLPPAVGGTGEDVDGASIRPPDLLPPPPPTPSMQGSDIDLPPPSPPPPPPIPPENGGLPMSNGPPPPPPPPPPTMNGVAPPPPRMDNGNIKGGRGVITNDGLGSVILKPTPKNTRPEEIDPRSDLLKAIRDGIKLRKVDAIKRGGSGSSSGGAGGRVPEDPSVDVASILQRRFAFEVSDSDTSSDTDSDSDDWDETSA